MTRYVSVTVLGLVVMLATARIAHAQSTGDPGTTGSSLPNGATIQFQHLKVYDKAKQDFVETEANSDKLLRAFNRANCNCARVHPSQGGGVPSKTEPAAVGWFQYLLIESASSGVRKPVDFWVGTSCTDDTTRNQGLSCKKLDYVGISDLDNDLFSKGGVYKTFNLYDIINGHLHDEATVAMAPGDDPNVDLASCQQLEGNAPLYTFVSTTGTADTYDYEISQNVGTLSTDPTTTANGIDTRPPPAPTDVVAKPSDESINISWTPSSSANTDIAYYQALCADLTGSVARSHVASHRYVTTTSLCNDAKPSDLALEALTATASPADNEQALGAPVGAFGSLNDDGFICGEASSATANSMSIHGLKNGTPYQVILLTIDLHGNFVGTYFDHTITPIPVTDFWEDIHDRGGKTEGGLCLLAETYGDDSSLTGALRAFRDDTLGGSATGRWLGRAYYATLGTLGGLVHGSLALRIAAGVVLAPVVALALLWHWLTLPGLFLLLVGLRLGWRWRRRIARAVVGPRRPALIAGAGALVLALVPGRAHAGSYEPYWENDPLDPSTDNNGQPSADPNYDPTFDPALDALKRNARNSDAIDKPSDGVEDVPPEDVHWHVGIRMGPYVPDIDKQFTGTAAGPYKQMFGGYNLVPMIDIDRVLWSGFGQVAVGGTIGYLQKSASAFVDGSSPNSPARMRVDGAENKFRLIPFALTATYRFTWLDDEYGIPLVPYVRGGLSYYIWQITAPDGDIAQVCKGTGTEPMCDQNTAFGASLGVQGTIGLAIRAERIEASAATSMRQSGIQHAGVFAELSAAKVDGFGSDKKLSVGDKTWFAGVEFEF